MNGRDLGAEKAKRYHRKAKWWDTDEDGHFVTLDHGWAFYDNVPEGGDGDACHVRGFDTVKKALADIRAAEPCHCARCKGIER